MPTAAIILTKAKPSLTLMLSFILPIPFFMVQDGRESVAAAKIFPRSGTMMNSSPPPPGGSVENPFEIRNDDELVFPFADAGYEFRLPMHADRRRLLERCHVQLRDLVDFVGND